MKPLIAEAATYLDITLTEAQAEILGSYADTLLDWNTRVNLTGIRDPEAVRIQHFLDSLSCLIAMGDAPIGRLIDIGTGAGFPGVVLKIMRPEMKVTLVDSVGKKTRFLEVLSEALKLDNVDVVTARAEEVGRDPKHRETYDWAIARAVGPLTVVAEYLLPLVRVGGRVLMQRGHGALSETGPAEEVFDLLGGALVDLVPVDLPGMDESRYLVLLEKISPTPYQYPRQVGTPAKRPL